ncbi:MAG: hypothetical protein C6I00_01890 [Nitratiruptor sp.]|nr:hypothetical protein [Nitratiruptor sp.]NPA84039.1 hypothetical protein [Campylobacterota bacterium]
MELHKLFQFHQGSLLSGELKLALAILGGIALMVLFMMWYMRLQKRRERYQFLVSLIGSKGFEEWEIKRLFRYLEKRHIDLNLLLESESVARSAAQATGLDVERTIQRLGFDTQALIQQFLQRQKELRKRWNGG